MNSSRHTKMFVDGTFAPNKSAVSAVICNGDETERVLGIQTECKSSTEAELKAILFGVRSIPKGVKRITIHSDCQSAVQYALQKNEPPQSLRKLVGLVCKEIEAHKALIKVQWIPRSQNKKADAVAAMTVRKGNLDKNLQEINKHIA